MQRIIYSEYVEIKAEPYNYMELQEKGEAYLLEFGVDYEELENGVGNYSTAIINLDDGTVKNIPVENIKFI